MAGEITEVSTARTVEANGMTVHYHDVGEGEPILMLASTGIRPGTTAWMTFGKVAPMLASHYRLIMMDLPNHGRTGPVVYNEPLHDMMARTGVALMSHLGYDRFTALGNSQGGQVATDIALLYPDKVERVICGACDISTGGDTLLFAPNPSARGSQVGRANVEANEDPTNKDKLRRLMNALVYDPSLFDDALFEQIYEMRTNHPEVWDAINKSPLVRKDNVHAIGNITVPTLLIWGRFDRFISLELGLAFLALLEQSELVVLNNCGHWPPFEKPVEYASHVLRFMQETTSA
jgi:pimeloyl-ACP methyl ester carboxylesterase